MSHDLDPTIVWVAQVGAPRADRAFDRQHPEWRSRALRYVRTRAAADLAALPRVEGRSPRTYGCRALSPAEYAAVQAMPSEHERAQAAVRMACLCYRDLTGTVSAPTEAAGRRPVATEAWLATLAGLGGLQLVAELGAVILRRAELGDITDPEEVEELAADPFGGYALPPGVGLAR